MENNNPKISVIVPVYNVKQYLPRCIDSILTQTFTDFELLLIDDGSKDDSGKICDKYAQKDKRIRVFHKENGGVSSARNKGIEYALGKYISFIDSDDKINPTYLQDFKVQEQHCDFYISGALYDTYDRVYSYKKYKEKFCENKYEIMDEFFDQDLLSNGYPWGKLYKTQIIKKNGLKFNEQLTINEDHLFVFNYFSLINTLYITNTAGYHYTVFDNSGRKLSGRINSFIELKRASEQFELIINKLTRIWNIPPKRHENLYNSFVASKRLLAFRSLILLKEKKYFEEEVNYWKQSAYTGDNKKEKIILFILRSKYLICKFCLCNILYRLIQQHSKHSCQKQVYLDLNSRSIKL